MDLTEVQFNCLYSKISTFRTIHAQYMSVHQPVLIKQDLNLDLIWSHSVRNVGHLMTSDFLFFSVIKKSMALTMLTVWQKVTYV